MYTRAQRPHPFDGCFRHAKGLSLVDLTFHRDGPMDRLGRDYLAESVLL